MNWEQRIDEALKDRQSQGLMRQRAAVSAGAGRWLESESGRWRNFAGNDYLGLARHPKVIAAWQAGAARYGTGSGGSGHVVGYSEAHRRLEQALAEWAGYPRALLFISGYAANQAVITALAGAKDALVADRLSHSSLLEAANLAPGRLRRFLHNDIESLKRQLSRLLWSADGGD